MVTLKNSGYYLIALMLTIAACMLPASALTWHYNNDAVASNVISNGTHYNAFSSAGNVTVYQPAPPADSVCQGIYGDSNWYSTPSGSGGWGVVYWFDNDGYIDPLGNAIPAYNGYATSPVYPDNFGVFDYGLITASGATSSISLPVGIAGYSTWKGCNHWHSGSPSSLQVHDGTNFENETVYYYSLLDSVYVSGNVSLLFYPNVTVTILSNSTGMTIPRVNVRLHNTGSSYIEDQTGLDGQVRFEMVPLYSSDTAYISADKAGYQNANVTPSWDITQPEISYTVYMDDSIWNSTETAVVYVDVASSKTGDAISGATVGIQNVTAGVDAWRYSTYPGPVIEFTTTGVYPSEVNLSTGQKINIAGYKTGLFTANNTGEFTISQAVSHINLILDPVEGNTSAAYYYPVTIVDATNGVTIANSTLCVDSSYYGTQWHNTTSATGKFNITGKGSSGTTPLVNGDDLTLIGQAENYHQNGFGLNVDDGSNKVTQVISLAPDSVIPKSGEFTAVFSVYDEDTTVGLTGAKVLVSASNYSQTHTTVTGGGTVFKNMTATMKYTAKISKSGYTETSKTFTGSSGEIVSIDIPLSSTVINPTPTVTVTVTSTGTYGPESSDDDLASWMRSKATSLLDFFYLFIIVGGLGMILRMWKII